MTALDDVRDELAYLRRVGSCPACRHNIRFSTNLRGECAASGSSAQHEPRCGCDHRPESVERHHQLALEAAMPVLGYRLVADDGAYYVETSAASVCFSHDPRHGLIFATEDEARAVADRLPFGFRSEAVLA